MQIDDHSLSRLFSPIHWHAYCTRTHTRLPINHNDTDGAAGHLLRRALSWICDIFYGYIFCAKSCRDLICSFSVRRQQLVYAPWMCSQAPWKPLCSGLYAHYAPFVWIIPPLVHFLHPNSEPILLCLDQPTLLSVITIRGEAYYCDRCILKRCIAGRIRTRKDGWQWEKQRNRAVGARQFVKL